MFQLQDFINFDRYLTPSIIQIFYFLQLALIVLFGISNIFAALVVMTHAFFCGLIWLAGTLLGVVIAAIAARIVTEIIMVLFQNNENLGVIRARAEGH